MEMGDKLPICEHEISPVNSPHSSEGPYRRYSSTLTQPNALSSQSNQQQTSSSFVYEEFMEGSVPCPSCNGSGRIPKEQEGQLIALIPYGDKRLKPRRTTLWVFMAIFGSVVVCALCMFFLIPRSIVLTSSDGELTPYYSYINETVPIVKLSFINDVNITNYNFVNIYVVNSTMKTYSLWDAGRQISQVTNESQISVPLRSERTLRFNTTIVFTQSFIPYYCQYVKVIFLQFDIVVTSHYLGHDEQTSVSARRNIKCSQLIFKS